MIDVQAHRELYHAYRALRDNACWEWLIGEMGRLRDYCQQRLLLAEDWEDFCALRARLETMNSMLALIDSVSVPPRAAEDEEED